MYNLNKYKMYIYTKRILNLKTSFVYEIGFSTKKANVDNHLPTCD